MSKSIKILFWLNKSKQNKKGLAPIIIRVSHANDRKQLSTGFMVSPQQWDSVKNKMKGRDAFSDQVNTYIRNTTNRLYEIYNDMVKRGDVYLETLCNKFLGKDCKIRSH